MPIGDSSLSFSYEIVPIILEVTWSGDLLTYTGSQQYPTATVYGELNDGEASITYSIGTTDGINVGTYTVTMVIGNSNYTAATSDLSKEFKITAAEISVVSWDENPLTYNSSEQHPTVTAFNGVFGEDNVQDSYSVTSGNGTDAGTHVVTVSINNSNYVLTGDATCAYTIAPITLGITWSVGTYTYNGNLQNPTATVTGTLNGEDVSESYTISSGNGIDAGSHTVKIVVGNSNYTVADEYLTQEFSISAANLTISNWSSDTLTYTGSLQYPTATFYEVFSQDGVQDDLQAIYTVTNGNGIDAGSHTVTVTIGNTNYSLTGSNLSQTYTISPITLTIVWNEGTLTYNGEQQHPEATIAGEVVYGEANVTYSVTGGDGINVGTTYIVTMTIGNSNYTAVDSDLSKQFEINAAEISVASWDQTSLVYSGAQQHPEVTEFSGVFGSDDVQASYSVTSGGGIDAGTHVVTVTIGNTNYSLIGDATHEYSIAQRTITIGWSNESFVYTGIQQHPTATVSNEITSGDAGISYSISGGNGTDAGGYTVTVVISNSNYTATGTSKEYTIAKADVSVSWNGGTASFSWSAGSIDADAAGITCSYEVYDNETDTWTATDSIENAGTYRATLTIAEEGNYQFASDAVTTQTFTVV